MGGGEGRPHWEQQLGGKDTIFRKYDRAADHRPCAAASFCAPFAGRGYPPLPSAFPSSAGDQEHELSPAASPALASSPQPSAARRESAGPPRTRSPGGGEAEDRGRAANGATTEAMPVAADLDRELLLEIA